jgi:site-specific DNA recombinase
MPDYYPPPTTLPPGSVVWAYLRDSGGPTQDRSVAQQRDVLTEFCARFGLVLEKTFIDIHKSGTKDNREQFHEMMHAIEIQPPAGLLLWSFARFARNETDAQYYKAVLRKKGLVIHSLINDIPEGKYQIVLEALIHVADAEKAEQAAWESRRGLHDIVKQGAVPGVKPTGFLREPLKVVSEDGTVHTLHKWVPDPAMLPLVQKAFEMRANGASLAQINAETRLFGSLNSYRTFFSNEIYLGTLRYGDMVIENYCAAMIDRATWERVQLISAKFTRHEHMTDPLNHPRVLGSHYVLSGLLLCGRCGSTLAGHVVKKKVGKRIESYRCTRGRRRRDCDLPTIPAGKLEQAVFETLRDFFMSDGYLEVYRAFERRKGHNLHELSQKIHEKQASLESLQRKIYNLSAAIAESGHSRALLDKLETLEYQANKARLELADIKAATQKKQPNYTDEQVKAQGQKLGEKLLTLEPSTKRTIIRGIVAEIFVDRSENDISAKIMIYLDNNDDPGSTPPTPDDPPERPSGERYGKIRKSPNRMPKALYSVGAPQFTHTIAIAIPIKKPHSC